MSYDDFPEPLQWNGDEDDRAGGYVNRRTGPPRDEPEGVNPRGLPCHTCGRPIHRVYTLADVGAFCSPGCRDEATKPKDPQKKAADAFESWFALPSKGSR